MSALELLAQAALVHEMNLQSNSSISKHRLPKKNLYYRDEANWVQDCQVPSSNSQNSSNKSSESNELNSSSNDSKLVIDLNEEQPQINSFNVESSDLPNSTFNLDLLANITALFNVPTTDNNSNNNLSNDNSISSTINTTIESTSTTKSAKKSTKKSTKKSANKSSRKSSTNNSLIETTTNSTSINSRPKRTIRPTQKLKFQFDFEEEIEIEIESRKKATKIPDNLKDENYLLKRKKNNAAAKKSRDKKNAKIDEAKLLHQINYEENQKLKQDLFHEIMLMKLIKERMNLDSEFMDLVKETAETNNLNYYNKLINFIPKEEEQQKEIKEEEEN